MWYPHDTPLHHTCDQKSMIQHYISRWGSSCSQFKGSSSRGQTIQVVVVIDAHTCAVWWLIHCTWCASPGEFCHLRIFRKLDEILTVLAVLSDLRFGHGMTVVRTRVMFKLSFLPGLLCLVLSLHSVYIRNSRGSLTSCLWLYAPEDTVHKQFHRALSNLKRCSMVCQQCFVWVKTLPQEMFDTAHCPLCLPVALRV